MKLLVVYFFYELDPASNLGWMPFHSNPGNRYLTPAAILHLSQEPTLTGTGLELCNRSQTHYFFDVMQHFVPQDDWPEYLPILYPEPYLGARVLVLHI